MTVEVNDQEKEIIKEALRTLEREEYQLVFRLKTEGKAYNDCKDKILNIIKLQEKFE